jgi:hypothetical protein
MAHDVSTLVQMLESVSREVNESLASFDADQTGAHLRDPRFAEAQSTYYRTCYELLLTLEGGRDTLVGVLTGLSRPTLEAYALAISITYKDSLDKRLSSSTGA